MAPITRSILSSISALQGLPKLSTQIQTATQKQPPPVRNANGQGEAASYSAASDSAKQSQVAKQAIQKTNDEITAGQLTEQGLREAQNTLLSAREVAVSALTENSPELAQQEQRQFNSEKNQLNYIATMQYKGDNLLSGNELSITSKAGTESKVTSVSIASVKSSDIGSIAVHTGKEVSDEASTDITLSMSDGLKVEVQSSEQFKGMGRGQDASSAYAKAASINHSGAYSVKAVASTSGTQEIGKIGGKSGDSYSLTINDTSVVSNRDASGGITAASLVDAINSKSSESGVRAKVENNKLTLTADDGRNISVVEDGNGFDYGKQGLTIKGGTFDDTLRGTVTVMAKDTVNIGGKASSIGQTSVINKDSKGLDSIDLTTKTGAAEAVFRIESAMETVGKSQIRANTAQNNLIASTGLQSIVENTSAAISSIKEVDFAAEVASMTKSQVLGKGGSSILSQADQNAQTVLSLLKY